MESSLRFTCATGAIVGSIAVACSASPEFKAFQGFETAAETDEFVKTFGRFIEFPDRDWDGAITDMDVILFFGDPFVMPTVIDENEDGLLDVKDAEITLRRTLAALAGDFNADGRIDDQDPAIGIDAVIRAKKYPHSFNQHMPFLAGEQLRLDLGDFARGFGASRGGDEGDRHDSALTTTIETLAEELLHDAGGGTVGVEENPHVVFFSSQFPGGERPIGWPPNHARTSSERWLEHAAPWSRSHAIISSSQRWPSNHEIHVSLGWDQIPPTDHAFLVSRLDWPPNHRWSISESWSDSPPGPSHRQQVSRVWPPSHTFANSRIEEHRSDISAAFPDDEPRTLPRPSDHLNDMSRSWGPVHDQSLSDQDIWPDDVWPEDHTTQASRGSPYHNKAVSDHGWPPNHDGSISSQWFDHAFQTSSTWPPSHFYGMSTTWPPNTRPRWPANHVAAVSETWYEPEDDLPWLPGDHSVLTTAQDIKDLLGVVPATSP